MSSSPSLDSLPSPPPAKGLGDQLYNDAASLGRLRALIGLIAGVVIAVIMIIIGIARLISASSKKHTMSVVATVTQLTGCQSLTPSNPSYECTVALSYTVNGVVYNVSSFSSTSKKMMAVGQTITVYYDPANPNDISNESRYYEKKIGWGLIGLAILIIGMAYFFWWLSNRYTFFAAAEGVGTVAQLFR